MSVKYGNCDKHGCRYEGNLIDCGWCFLCPDHAYGNRRGMDVKKLLRESFEKFNSGDIEQAVRFIGTAMEIVYERLVELEGKR